MSSSDRSDGSTPSSAATVDEDVRVRSVEYLEKRGAQPLEAFEEEFEGYLRRLRRWHPLTPGTRLLEIGVGTGWFLVLCRRHGLACDGVELNPVFAEHARRLGREHGLDLDVKVGDIARVQLPHDHYDIVIAMSVFEHVRDHHAGMRNVHRALKPDGLFYVNSTNKLAPRSGEYAFPLYGWMPYTWRLRLRLARQGPVVLTSSQMDFHQFTHRGLKRDLRKAGFTAVQDQFEFLDAEMLQQPTAFKRTVLETGRRFPPVRTAARAFAAGTCVIARK